jgi:hypothetical protein
MINYTSLINTNGNIYNYESGKSILLAKYNLYVGQNCTSSSTSSCTPISTAASGYGLQSADAKGYLGNWTNPAVATVPFSGVLYWSTTSNIYDTNYITAPNYSGQFYNRTDNPNYSIAYYVEEYVDRLGIEGEGRLLTYTEAAAMTQVQRDNGARYWLGSAYNDYYVWCVSQDGFMAGNQYVDVYSRGVRPVIVINTSYIH